MLLSVLIMSELQRMFTGEGGGCWGRTLLRFMGFSGRPLWVLRGDGSDTRPEREVLIILVKMIT